MLRSNPFRALDYLQLTADRRTGCPASCHLDARQRYGPALASFRPSGAVIGQKPPGAPAAGLIS
jgi:hypothetical protein